MLFTQFHIHDLVLAHDGERHSDRRAVTKRTFGQTGLVIYTWYANHSLIKTIWVMAISQHQFYLDRKQSKAKMTAARSLGDIAVDLTENGAAKTTKLNVGTKNQLIMASNGSLVSTGSADSEMNDEQKREKLAELRVKEKEIQALLSHKMAELKEICLREAELTGKLPKEYPMGAGEKPPGIRRRIGTSFKLDELFPYNEDPYLRNLESRFALQRKIVEAAKKLASEHDIGKTVKKKRRRNCLDAMQKLQEIEDEMNRYRVKKGKRPTQRASRIIAEELGQSECSSLSDSIPLDENDASQRRRSRSLQCSPLLNAPPTVSLDYDTQRRSSESDTHHDTALSRLECDGQPGLYYTSHDASSASSSPYKTVPRRQAELQNVAQTLALTRNAYSSSQLGSDGPGHAFRHRSGSLESQSHFLCYSSSERSVFPGRRSNSSEILDDCSSCTSVSSADFGPPCPSTPPYLIPSSLHHQPNTGSMPNLVPHHTHTHAHVQTHPRTPYSPAAYYVPGYATSDYEPYANASANGAYVYENELEGHYNVNPSYHAHGYHGNGRSKNYGMVHNPYATLRPPRSKNELLAKTMQKALVVEHLRGWYNRNTAGRKPVYGYEYDRGYQHLGYQTLPAPFSRSSRTSSYSSVSSTASGGTNWHTNADLGRSESEVDGDITPTSQKSFAGAYSPTRSRFPTEGSPSRRTDSLPHTSECGDVFTNDTDH